MRAVLSWVSARWPVLLVLAMWLVASLVVLALVGAWSLLLFMVLGPVIGWLACAHEDTARRRQALANYAAANRYIDGMHRRGVGYRP